MIDARRSFAWRTDFGRDRRFAQPFVGGIIAQTTQCSARVSRPRRNRRPKVSSSFFFYLRPGSRICDEHQAPNCRRLSSRRSVKATFGTPLFGTGLPSAELTKGRVFNFLNNRNLQDELGQYVIIVVRSAYQRFRIDMTPEDETTI